jgi:hypothetical protein
MVDPADKKAEKFTTGAPFAPLPWMVVVGIAGVSARASPQFRFKLAEVASFGKLFGHRIRVSGGRGLKVRYRVGASIYREGSIRHRGSITRYKYYLGEVGNSNWTSERRMSFSLKIRFFPAQNLYNYMLERIQIPLMPMSAVVMTVNMAAGIPILIPFGPSQSAGTVRVMNCGGTLTLTEERQAIE